MVYNMLLLWIIRIKVQATKIYNHTQSHHENPHNHKITIQVCLRENECTQSKSQKKHMAQPKSQKVFVHNAHNQRYFCQATIWIVAATQEIMRTSPLIVLIQRSMTPVLFRFMIYAHVLRWMSSLFLVPDIYAVTLRVPCNASAWSKDTEIFAKYFHIQKSLKRRSSLALASGTFIQSVSAYSSKFRVSPENSNFGTIGGFNSFDLTPSQSIVLKKLKWWW